MGNIKDPLIIEARRMLCQYLKDQAVGKGISTYKLAELTGFDQPNIHRILSGKYSPTLDTFMVIARALDCYIFIFDKNADDDTVEMMRNRWRRSCDRQ